MLWKFLITVFALSWPFQLLSVFYGNTLWKVYLFNGLSMTMVGIGTFLHCKISKEEYPKLTLGRRKYLMIAVLLPFITFLPFTSQKLTFKPYILLFPLLNLIPAYGEEVGWRAYLLPKLLNKLNIKKALIVHGIIWSLWHAPLLVGSGISLFSIFLLILTIIGGTLHGVVFAYLYFKAGLLGVTIYHALYDGIRDGLIEMGADPSPWIVIIVGIYLLITAEKWFSEVRQDV